MATLVSITRLADLFPSYNILDNGLLMPRLVTDSGRRLVRLIPAADEFDRIDRAARRHGLMEIELTMMMGQPLTMAFEGAELNVRAFLAEIGVELEEANE